MKENYLDTHNDIISVVEFNLYKNLYKGLLKKVDDELILDLRQDLFWIRWITRFNSDINNSVRLKMGN